MTLDTEMFDVKLLGDDGPAGVHHAQPRGSALNSAAAYNILPLKTSSENSPQGSGDAGRSSPHQLPANQSTYRYHNSSGLQMLTLH